MDIAHVDIAVDPRLEPGVGLLLAVLEDTTNEWRGEMGDVPDEAVIWQPFPGGHSIGALLLHIADVEAFWIHEVAAGRLRTDDEKRALLSEQTRQDDVQWPTPPAQPLSWYFAQHDVVRGQTRRLVAEINTLEHLGRHSGQRGDFDFTLRWLLNHVISHEAYHGGQAVLLSLLRERLPETGITTG